MDLKGFTSDELLEEFACAVAELPGTGARGRSRFYDAKEELSRRLGGEEYEEVHRVRKGDNE